MTELTKESRNPLDGTAAHGSYWSELVPELEAAGRTEDVLQLVLESLGREFPDLAADPEVALGTRDVLLADYRLFLDVLRHGVPPEEVEPTDAGLAIARDLARRGVSIAVLTRAYLIAHVISWRWGVRWLRTVIDDPAAAAESIEELATVAVGFVDVMTAGLVEAYAAERERWVRSAAAVRTEVINELLAGADVSVAESERKLRYRLADRFHVAFVVWSDDPSDGTELEREGARVARLLDGSEPLFSAPSTRTLWGWTSYRSSPPRGFSDDVSPSGEPFGVAIGSPAEGVGGFRCSHTEALEARRVARLGGRDGALVVSYRDVALPALLTSDPSQAHAFVRRELGELGELAAEDEQTRRLAHTLAVYLELGSSPRRAAERLGVHENTVANRVRAAGELLGRPLEHRVTETLVALRLSELLGRPERG